MTSSNRHYLVCSFAVWFSDVCNTVTVKRDSREIRACRYLGYVCTNLFLCYFRFSMVAVYVIMATAMVDCFSSKPKTVGTIEMATRQGRRNVFQNFFTFVHRSQSHFVLIKNVGHCLNLAFECNIWDMNGVMPLWFKNDWSLL